FWDFLDEAGIPSTFFDLPSNYPPSPSHHGHSRCISGMGTPDMLGTYGTYQHFADNGPQEPVDEGGGKRFKLVFDGDTAKAQIIGPQVDLDGTSRPLSVDFLVHRDRRANAAAIEVQGQKILLNAGQWSRWTRLAFEMPWYTRNVHGIVRFLLQEV